LIKSREFKAQLHPVIEERLTEMESPTVKGLENCNDTPLSIFPKISLAAKAVATPVFGTKKISRNQHHKSKQTNIYENSQ
jgi:hypothetical protein